MASQALDGQSLWEVCTTDPAFEGMPIAFHSIVREYLGHMELVLKPYLELPVQLTSLAAAKHAFLEFRLKQGYYHQISAVLSGEDGPTDPSVLEKNLTHAYMMLNWLKVICEDPGRYQLAYGQDILDILKKHYAKPEVLTAIRQECTIRDLLCLQPMLIFIELF